ncbi:hypothetical protein PIB30_096192 [Stylosanthes scabra]|uniref:Uncharacterized protein n=1 Tax=Stylosanthes scabra TaxID=79078 RepID=A0ABU6XWN1_9FABA|nr:hypothetical protein [Stylosanthes scabra]
MLLLPDNDLHDLIHVQLPFTRLLEPAFSFQPWEVEDTFYVSKVARDLPPSHVYLSLILLIAVCIKFPNQRHVDINRWIVHEVPSLPSNVFPEGVSYLVASCEGCSGKMHREFLLRVALQHFFLFRPSTKHRGYKSDQEKASNH